MEVTLRLFTAIFLPVVLLLLLQWGWPLLSGEPAPPVVGGIALAVALLIGVRARRLVAQPISSIRCAMQRIGDGHMDAEVSGEIPGALGEMGEEFNRMAEAVRAERQQLRERIARATERLSDTLVRMDDANSVMRATLDSVVDGIMVVDIEGRIIAFNRRLERLWGLRTEEIVNNHDIPILTFIADRLKDRKPFLTIINRLTKHTQDSLYETLELQDGRIFEFSYKTFHLAGEPSGRIWSFRDITDQTRMNDALRWIAEGTASKTGGDFLFSLADYLTTTLRVRYVHIGEPLDEDPNRLRTLALHGGLEIPEVIEEALQGPFGKVYSRRDVCFFPADLLSAFPDDPLIRRAGVTSFLGLPLIDSSQRVIGHLALLDDKPMTRQERFRSIALIFAARAGAELERKHTESALRAAKDQAVAASRAKSEFLANMSHEIRTPMNGIIGFTRMLRKARTDEERNDYLETIEKSSEGLLAIVNDILDFSKIEAGKLTVESRAFDLRQTLEDTVALLAPSAYDKGLNLTLLIYSDVPVRLFGDPLRIRQVVTNLIGNAIKFTDQGSVVVRVMLEKEGEREVELRVSVSDTGVGLTQEERLRLFNAFTQVDASTTRRHGGTGLGLAISKRLVEQMGGEIGLESESEQGSTFWFTLRCRVQPDGDEAMPSSLSGLRALLYDAHFLSRLALRHSLEALGLELEEVDDWGSTLERLRTPSDVPLDLLVLGLSHHESYESLLEELPDHPPPTLVLLSLAERPSAMPGKSRESVVAVLPKYAGRNQLRQVLEALRSPPPRTTVTRDEGLAGRGLHALVVDDHEINRKLARTLLSSRGIEVVEARDGGEAIEAANGREFDFILMDIHMPGMSGLEAATHIRAAQGRGRRTPIFAVTAYAQPSEREQFLAGGLDDVVSKPVQEELLWALLEEHGIRTDAPHPAEKGAGATDDRLLGEMRDLLREELPTHRRSIELAAEEDDREALRHHIHKLHGAAAYCREEGLRRVAKEAEQALAETGSREMDEHLSALYAEMARMQGLGDLRDTSVEEQNRENQSRE